MYKFIKLSLIPLFLFQFKNIFCNWDLCMNSFLEKIVYAYSSNEDSSIDSGDSMGALSHEENVSVVVQLYDLNNVNVSLNENNYDEIIASYRTNIKNENERILVF